MLNAYSKDILRTIKNNAKRFIALMIITALGLTAFAGIHAACQDYYLSADRFYDEQHLFDVRVLSTLGLTKDDVDALQSLDAVETADGSFRRVTHTLVRDIRQSVEIIMISPKGINAPYLLTGALPNKPGEIAVDSKYLTNSGKEIGDTLSLEEVLNDTSSFDDDDEEEKPLLKRTEFTITASVTDPMNIANSEGTAAFRFMSAAEYTFFILPEEFDIDIYTSIYLTLKDTSQYECYSPEYATAVADAIDGINSHIKSQREKARYDEVVTDALDKLTEAETEMNDKFAEADTEITDAWEDIEKAKKELTDGTATLTEKEKESLQKISDAKAELESGKAKLEDSEKELNAGIDELNANIQKANDGQSELDAKWAEAEAGFTAAEAKLQSEQNTLNSEAAKLPSTDSLSAPLTAAGQTWPDSAWNSLVTAATNATVSQLQANPTVAPSPSAVAAASVGEQATLQAALQTAAMPLAMVSPTFDIAAYIGGCIEAAIGHGIVSGSQSFLDSQIDTYNTQKADALKQLEDAQAELDAGYVAIEAAKAEIASGQEQLDEGWAEYNEGAQKLTEEEANAKKQLTDAWQELKDGEEELADGEKELQDNEKEYLDEKSSAEEELADAYAKLDEVDMTKWYVQDRTSIDSYAGLDTDLRSIGVIGKAFPVLFLIVAILISLTTMTRMVEEERGLIGTYKALGFGNLAIGAKYLIYALAASIAGTLLGCISGFIVLPKLLFTVLNVIYVIPNVTLHFDLLYAAIGASLFVVSILIATILVCRKELKRVPASLMRPKSPRMGARILLERIPVIWQRLKFLNKITARNIFRYKKRLIMTVFGIASCTALVLTGFAIRDSVIDLMPLQYDHIDRYDLLTVANPGEEDKLISRLTNDVEVTDFLAYQTSSVKMFNSENASTNLYLIVVPDEGDFGKYMNIFDLDGNLLSFDDEGVYVTQNAAELLKLKAGDDIVLQTLQLDQYDVKLQNIVENYLGNNVFITETLFESLIEEFEPNAAYAHLDAKINAKEYAKELANEDYITTSLSSVAVKEQFSTDFAILNFVIYILIVLAACLAFVVLFTLASTNISERMRELATIKVLGFYDREVYSYVNKETLLLTFISVILGMPLGYLLSGLLLSALKMPEIQFVLIIRPQSYILAAIISFSFTVIVNMITNRMLNKINMVEALKSVE